MNKICLGYFQHNSKFLKWLFFFFQYPHRKVLLFPIQIHLLLKLTALLQKDCAEDNLTDLFTSMWSNLPHNYLTLPDRCQNLFFHYCYWSHWANLLCVSIQNEPNTLSNIFTHIIFFFFFNFLSVLLHPCSNLGWTVHSYGNPLDLRPGSLGQVAPSLLEGSPEHLFWKHCEPVQRNMVPGEEGRGIKTSRRYGRKPPLLAFTQSHMRLLWITTNSLHSLDYGVSEYWQKMYTTIALWPDQICSLSTSGFTFCLYWSTIRPILKVVAVCV